jgi:hypothetical protein
LALNPLILRIGVARPGENDRPHGGGVTLVKGDVWGAA